MRSGKGRSIAVGEEGMRSGRCEGEEHSRSGRRGV